MKNPIRILDETKIKIELNNNEITIYDQHNQIVGKQFFSQRVMNKDATPEKQNQFRKMQSEKLQEAIQNILKEVVLERGWYDVWLTATSITFFSPSSNLWVTEPKLHLFEYVYEQLSNVENASANR